MENYIEDDGFEYGYGYLGCDGCDGCDDEYDAAREDELMARFGHLAEEVL